MERPIARPKGAVVFQSQEGVDLLHNNKRVDNIWPLVSHFISGPVLEMGSGTGRVSAWIRSLGIEPLCADNSDVMLSEMGKKCFNTIKIDLDKLPYPFPDASFNTIIGINVLEHLQSPAAIFAEAYRLLRLGGRLIVCMPDCASLLPTRWDHVSHTVASTGKGWAFMMAQQGFKVQQLANPILITNPYWVRQTQFLWRMLHTTVWLVGQKQ